MRHGRRELWLAFIAVILITIAYSFVAITLGGIPPAREFFGHSLGILGFLLMLMTETLYTMRKRSRKRRWGPMASWLRFHIFTGLVGPYLVLLHTSWKFNGLAGVVALMTAVVVASGFIGRYIYTSVPRSIDGIEIEASEMEKQISAIEAELRAWLAAHPEDRRDFARQLVPLLEVPENSFTLVLGRVLADWRYRLQWWRVKRRLKADRRSQVTLLENLIRRRHTLHRQVGALAQARRLLALWHSIHIPIGLALFTAAFIHIGAAIYYATLLR